MAMVTADSFRGFDLRFEELNSRLKQVKKEFGMRRAISTRSLTGETRTFAEILDQQVENIVLYYLEIQGFLAKQTRMLRQKQVRDLQDYTVTLDVIENLCQKYRDIGAEMVELLKYLERNSIALRKILRRHDTLFDQKMGSMYFDSRLQSNSKDSQLRQLYHQEGIRAVMGSLRRGFEELYDARKALIESTDGDFTFTPFTTNSSDERWSVKAHCVPKISFRKRLQSFSNLLAHATDIEAESKDLRTNNTRTKSAGDGDLYVHEEVRGRTLSDLEPVLRRISDLANRLVKTQSSTTLEFLSSHSSLGLEFKMRDMRREEEGEDDDSAIATDSVGLAVHHLLTFLYLANQYVVAPSSAEYAMRLGMGSAMSGMIIGLTPLAALLSSLLYSMWSNVSFKRPMLVSVLCALLGNLLYGMALQTDSALLIVLGRLLTGFGGPRAVSRRYIADHVALGDRLMASSQFVTAGALGLAAGPLIASLIEVLGLQFIIRGVDGRVLVQYEKVTACGWIMAGAWALAFVAVLFFFREPHIRHAHRRKEEEQQALLSAANSAKEYGSSSRSKPAQSIVYVETGNELWASGSDPELQRAEEIAKRKSALYTEPNHLDSNGFPSPAQSPARTHQHGLTDLNHLAQAMRGDSGKDRADRDNRSGSSSCWDHISSEVQTILFLYVVNKAGQELVVSSMPLLLKGVFLWPSAGVGYCMAAMGALVLPANLTLNFLVAKDAEERDMALRLSALALLGVLVVMHLLGAYSLLQYLVGAAIVFTALNALEGIIMSLLARLLSPELSHGTFNSGLLATEAGTFGRVVGDMAITVVGQSALPASLVNLLYLPLACLMAVSVALVYRNYDKLID